MNVALVRLKLALVGTRPDQVRHADHGLDEKAARLIDGLQVVVGAYPTVDRLGEALVVGDTGAYLVEASALYPELFRCECEWHSRTGGRGPGGKVHPCSHVRAARRAFGGEQGAMVVEGAGEPWTIENRPARDRAAEERELRRLGL